MKAPPRVPDEGLPMVRRVTGPDLPDEPEREAARIRASIDDPSPSCPEPFDECEHPESSRARPEGWIDWCGDCGGIRTYTNKRWNELASRALVALSLLSVGACKQPDHVFDATGAEIDCHGRTWDLCVAAHCLHGYELIHWGDLGTSSTYRCNP